MKIINKEEFLSEKEFYIEEMGKGKIFIYPTDTIYGIGCNAMIGESVQKIRRIKKRDLRPFSVIVPGKEWVGKNCYMNKNAESWLTKLPGPYTLILKLKNWEAVNSSVNGGINSIGVRIPDNWFAEIIKEFGMPFVTTSVNISGKDFVRDVNEIDKDIKRDVDYIINDGVLDGKPSTIIKLLDRDEEIIERK